MREIKFRGYTKTDNYWVEGHLTTWDNHDGTIDYQIKYGHENCSITKTVLGESVGQYTGIHDETDDDTEIYEGHIVEFVYEDAVYIGEIKFESGAFIIASDNLPDGYITMLEIVECDRDYCWIPGKVIGNIFLNPELLQHK